MERSFPPLRRKRCNRRRWQTRADGGLWQLKAREMRTKYRSFGLTLKLAFVQMKQGNSEKCPPNRRHASIRHFPAPSIFERDNEAAKTRPGKIAAGGSVDVRLHADTFEKWKKTAASGARRARATDAGAGAALSLAAGCLVIAVAWPGSTSCTIMGSELRHRWVRQADPDLILGPNRRDARERPAHGELLGCRASTVIVGL